MASIDGRVPRPNDSMINPPFKASPETADQVNAEYTSPHGNQPQIKPNGKAYIGCFSGNKRFPAGEMNFQIC